ncbi:hypothetical protein BH11PLA2_BH11PLA2_34640 [soil metagenome]
MTISVAEAWDSGQIGTEGGPLSFIILGTDDYVLALQSLIAFAPLTVGTSILSVKSYGPLERLTQTSWRGEVQYEVPDLSVAGDSSYNFEIGGGQQKVSQSITTVNRYGQPGRTAPNFNGAIGVTKEGVEGVEINLPTYDFSETHIFDESDIDDPYKVALFDASWTVNNATWRGFSAGQVLFKGASGSKERGKDSWEITFKFSASRNATGLSVGIITGIAKRGWDHLWVLYEEWEDTVAKRVVKRALGVYVEQVYEYTDFSTIGIGT